MTTQNLDEREWKLLIVEALEYGITEDQIRSFFESYINSNTQQ
jgi:hypothetical protein